MKRPRLALIVAVAENGVIGRQGDLPWRLPKDLAYFKAKTLGHHIVMGRKTHESVGRALPGRTNIVLTRDRAYEAPGCVVVHDLDAALEHAAAAGDDEVFVIGGAAVYAEALPAADRIYLTRVHADVPGDVRFPALAASWREVSREEHATDERHALPFSFCVLEQRPERP